MDLRDFSEGGGGSPAGSPEGQATFSRFFGGEAIDVPVVGAAQATAVAGGFELLSTATSRWCPRTPSSDSPR